MFVERLLFEGVSFELNKGDRLGFLGSNGTGKTTLLRILAGSEKPDEGAIFIDRDAKIGTMEQTLSTEGNATLYDAALEAHGELLSVEAELDRVNARLLEDCGDQKLIRRQNALVEQYQSMGGATYRARTRSTLLGIGFTESELKKPVSALSGGQRNKAQLAKLLLSGANLLLLDEPTNHLDLNSIRWLEEFLSAYSGAFIVVSHDRYFLDRVTNRTMELKNQHITMTDGNYSRYVELTSSAEETVLRNYLNTKKEIRRIEGIIEQQRRWNQARNFITIKSKQKQIDRLKTELVEPEKQESAIRFKFGAKSVSGNDVIICDSISKAYDNKLVFKDANLLIKRGERAFLLGPNGCGKTTLLRIITGREAADSGRAAVGANVSVGYYDQIMSGLNLNNTALEEIHDAYPRMNISEVRGALAAFLFRADAVNTKLSVASGGEKARIQLLKLMLQGANTLLLDEPTNHLDIRSREALEDALMQYDGTMLIVTHDRYLINKLSDRILSLDKDGITEYLGGYDDYASAQEEERAPEKQTSGQKQNEYLLSKEKRGAINRLKGELTRLEGMIDLLETELLQIGLRMQETETAADYLLITELSNKAAELKKEVESHIMQWEQKQDELNSLERQA